MNTILVYSTDVYYEGHACSSIDVHVSTSKHLVISDDRIHEISNCVLLQSIGKTYVEGQRL